MLKWYNHQLMNAKKPVISYAQYQEDLILAALLHDTKKGFYVDVGANHEEVDSVTKFFYTRGWSGINIEPISRLASEFRVRRRDITINSAVSDHKSTVRFREYVNHDGLSLVVEDNSHADDKGMAYEEYEVPVDTLANIFDIKKVRSIDFLKIDVEGLEEGVLRGNDWKIYRPRVVCIEANHRKSDWSKLLTSNGYQLYIYDGLNEYYVANEDAVIKDGFAERVVMLSQMAVSPQQFREREHIIGERQKLSELVERQDRELNRLLDQNKMLLRKLQNPISALRYATAHLTKRILVKLKIV
jgi:FkbM family methyltransferase